MYPFGVTPSGRAVKETGLKLWCLWSAECESRSWWFVTIFTTSHMSQNCKLLITTGKGLYLNNCILRFHIEPQAPKTEVKWRSNRFSVFSKSHLCQCARDHELCTSLSYVKIRYPVVCNNLRWVLVFFYEIETSRKYCGMHVACNRFPAYICLAEKCFTSFVKYGSWSQSWSCASSHPLDKHAIQDPA